MSNSSSFKSSGLLSLQNKSFVVLRARIGQSKISKKLIESGANVVEFPKIEYTFSQNADSNLFSLLSEYQKNPSSTKAVMVADAEVLDRILSFKPKEFDRIFLENTLVLIGEKAIELALEKGYSFKSTIKGMCVDDLKGHSSILSSLTKVDLLCAEDSFLGLVSDLEKIYSLNVEKTSLFEKKTSYFTLPSKVDGFISASSTGVAHLDASGQKVNLNITFFSIGERTSQKARDYGFNKITTSKVDSIDSLLETLFKSCISSNL